MYSLETVRRKAFKKECIYENIQGGIASLYTDRREAIKKRYERYYSEIVKALEVEKEVKRYIKKNPYVFSEQGAELLAEVFYLQYLTKKDNITYKSQQNLAEQILGNGQYNAFAPENELCRIENEMLANDLVVKAIECFYQLFIDNGVNEAEARLILDKPAIKYSYSARKYYSQLLGIMVEFVRKMQKTKQNEHLRSCRISKRENDIWLDFAVKQMKEKMAEIFEIREQMVDIRSDEMTEQIENSYNSEADEKAGQDMYWEHELVQRCLDDIEIQKLAEEFEKNEKIELDIRNFVKCVLGCKDKNCDDMEYNCYITKLVLKDELKMVISGEIVYKKAQEKNRERILERLITKINEMDGEFWEDHLSTNTSELTIRDEELLEQAIGRYKEVSNSYKELCLHVGMKREEVERMYESSLTVFRDKIDKLRKNQKEREGNIKEVV